MEKEKNQEKKETGIFDKKFNLRLYPSITDITLSFLLLVVSLVYYKGMIPLWIVLLPVYLEPVIGLIVTLVIYIMKFIIFIFDIFKR